MVNYNGEPTFGAGSPTFVSVAQYASALGLLITDPSTMFDRVSFELDAACAEIRGYLGQTLDPVTGDVVALDGTGRRGLILPEHPATAVNAVTIDLGLASEIVVTDAYLDFGGILYRKGTQVVSWSWHCHPPHRAWPLGLGNVTVDYDHGWDPIPSDLVMVAIQVARANINAGQPGLTGETIGGYAYTRDLSYRVMQQYERLLDNYKLPRVMVA